MLLETAVIALGIVGSFFLKNINFLALDFVYPDFLLIFIVYFALRRGEFAGIWIGFLAGLLEDSNVLAFSVQSNAYVSVIGTHMLTYSLLGYVLGRFNRIIDHTSMAPAVAVTFIAALSTRAIIWMISYILMQEANKNYSFVLTSVYTALIAPIWFWILGWTYRIAPGKEES